MSKARLLIVEDDRPLSEVLAYNLRQAGYEVHVASDGREGLRQAELVAPDLIVLDLMLPLVDGLEVCRRLRYQPATQNMLVLMLTAKAEEADEVVGLSLGADDYMTKPFSVRVLVERVHALLRRRHTTPDHHDVATSHGIMVDRRRHRVTAEEVPLNLTRSEFRLLDCLVRQPGRAFSRSELINAAVGEDSLVMERTIDVHIRALRQKLGGHAELIETVRGVGYRFRDESP